MRPYRATGSALAAALVIAGLSGCSPAPQHKNLTHPSAGEAEYRSDLAQCRKSNSKLVTSNGYDVTTAVQVDEAKAQSCMTERGWQG